MCFTIALSLAHREEVFTYRTKHKNKHDSDKRIEVIGDRSNKRIEAIFS